jgi:hypothetical protein
MPRRYMYGGRLGSREYYDDVHVLSLPSFIWTKVVVHPPGIMPFS